MADEKMERGICRDYERGVCNRGDRCKFFHPEDLPQPDKKLPICKDYQNKGCDRTKCKFLHITADEEALYNTTGQLPEHGGNPEKVAALFGVGGSGGGSVSVGGGGSGSFNSYRSGFGGGAASFGAKARGRGDDVCKDFLNNVCTRGKNCKFRHLTEREYALERQVEELQTMQAIPAAGAPDMANMYGKRRREESDVLAEENEMLRRKITDLQRQVLDLRQMNDTLYEQNTRYRNQLRGTVAATVTAVPAYADPKVFEGYTKF